STHAAMTRPLRRLFDVPTKEPSRFFRQELMGTATARRGPAPTPDPTVEDLLEIARAMRLVSELTREERTLLVQLRTLPSWRPRVRFRELPEVTERFTVGLRIAGERGGVT